MKKKTLILSLAVFLLLTAIGIGWLALSPRGALRSQGPADAAQAFLDAHDRAFFREAYIRLEAPEVSEFEDAAAVAGGVFDAGVPEAPFTFRAASGGGKQQDYILSAGGIDVLTLRASYADGRWSAEPMPLGALRGECRTLTVTVPRGTALTLNGKSVDEGYITESALPFPGLSELEKRFDDPPALVRYAVPDFYGTAELTASRDGGLLLLRSDGTDWEYTMPDALSHTFYAAAPREAEVAVCGAVLGDGDITASMAYPTLLDIPAELQPYLPDYAIYTAGGLCTPPRISAVLPDGTALDAAEAEGRIFFPLPSAAAPEELTARADAFLRAFLNYGAGHVLGDSPYNYFSGETPLVRYIRNASGSLVWVFGIALTFEDVSLSGFVPLGDDAYLCRAHVDADTVTRYESQELSLDFEMLWVRQNNVWYCQDLAFA